jgi:hypothetical protein
MLTFQLTCSNLGPYCIEYGNGTLHDVLSFEILVCVAAVIAVFGYWKASHIYWDERTSGSESELKDYRRESIDAYRQSRISGRIENNAYLAMETIDDDE